ncbi:hypothetical protein GCM10022280_11930 [Sphingomonas swuensis]|uniref:Lipoprotein n=1 Tax=Sphingomonas swuensis TaxID=977800 RepID=A0ABP7SRI2_9SPHN
MSLRVARLLIVPMLGLSLGGCVAGMAASAIGAAVRSSQQGEAVAYDGNAVRLAASSACQAQAAAYGTVHIIDVEMRDGGKAIVWGTVSAPAGRRSFECRFDRRVTGFKLRPI